MFFVHITAVGVVLVEGIRFGKRECGFGFSFLHLAEDLWSLDTVVNFFSDCV